MPEETHDGKIPLTNEETGEVVWVDPNKLREFFESQGADRPFIKKALRRPFCDWDKA